MDKIDELTALVSRRTPGLMDGRGNCAVLVPLVRGEEGWTLLYEVRARKMHHQPGEVCFPGGRMEPGETPEQSALRETWEELGIPASAVQVIGPLDYIAHRAGFLLYPILGIVDPAAVEHMRLNPSEVGETFWVPLSRLLDEDGQVYTYTLMPQPREDFPYELLGIPRDYHWRTGKEIVPVYPWEDKAIWGLTGRITRHLLKLIRSLDETI